MSKPLVLHPRLDADCHRLGRWPEGVLLLHRNATLPWFILVPEGDVEQLIELPTEQRQAVTERWYALAAWVGRRFTCDRVNLGAIGNLVPQLHLHAIGRRHSDPAWPGVAWGVSLPDARWSEDDVEALAGELQKDLALQP